MCRGFKQDCPDGQLGKDKILEMYSMILPAGNAKEKILLIHVSSLVLKAHFFSFQVKNTAKNCYTHLVIYFFF
jgi:hypothetical protein